MVYVLAFIVPMAKVRKRFEMPSLETIYSALLRCRRTIVPMAKVRKRFEIGTN